MQPLFHVIEPEIVINYPRVWEAEYKEHGHVGQWMDECRDMYEKSASNPLFPCLSNNPRTLDLFAQYALMYLLRKRENFHSLTWYGLAQTSLKIKNLERRDAHHLIMRRHIGDKAFETLQSALIEAGLAGWKGEPDLVSWHPDTGEWFFAEAKGKDRFTLSEQTWFSVCREVLGPSVDLRVYRLRPAD